MLDAGHLMLAKEIALRHNFVPYPETGNTHLDSLFTHGSWPRIAHYL